MTGIIAIFCIFTLSGMLTGLLGLGGGLVIVPVFMAAMSFPGINLDYSIHQITGISSACVFVNSAVTVFLRRNEKFLNRKFIVRTSIATIIGTLSGAILSSFASDKFLLFVFAAISLISIYLINKDIDVKDLKINTDNVIYPVFGLIGAISASIGIGGALLFATALKILSGKNAKELLPTITLTVLVHAFFAFLGKSLTGNVVFSIIPLAIPASFLGAFIGIKLSKQLTAKRITQLMSIFLLIATVKALWQFFVI